VDDDVRALRAIRSVLRPGGELLLSVPQHRWLWSQADEFAGHRRRYTREELAAKLQSAGLEVVWSSSFTTLTLPLMWLSRRLARPNADPWREFEILQWMNRILGAVMAVEFAMIRCGLRLPAGGSLLLLARSSPRATENPISADMTTGTDV
jgi:SAM-dependent methyltransferase